MTAASTERTECSSVHAAVSVPSSCASGWADPPIPKSCRNSKRSRVPPARTSGAVVTGTRRDAGSALLHRQRQGGRESAASSPPTGRRPGAVRSRALAQPGTQSRRSCIEPPRARSHRPDPRHLRAARAQPRRQARSGARAAEAHRDAPGARLDPPRAAEGRHRPARSRRNAARNRPPPARPARQDAQRAAREGHHSSARRRGRERKRAEIPTLVALVGYTNAGKSTLFSPHGRGCVRRRSAVRDAGSDRSAHSSCPMRGSRCSPTRSGSSASCRTSWSRRSSRRSPKRARPACCCTSSMRRSAARTSTSRRSTACSARSARARCRRSKCSTRPISSASRRASRPASSATCGACGCPRRRGRARSRWSMRSANSSGRRSCTGTSCCKPEEGRARARFFAAGAVLAEQALPGGSVDLEVSMPRQAFEDLCRHEGLTPDVVPSAAKTCAHAEPFLESRGPASLAS